MACIKTIKNTSSGCVVYTGSPLEFSEICTNDSISSALKKINDKLKEVSETGGGGEGKTAYIHIKYSDDGGYSFTDNDGDDPGKYIGVYTDFTEEDSDSTTDYNWSKIEGPAGADGPPNKLQIGTVQSGTSSSASITGSAPNQILNLTLEKGEKGDQGAKGEDGSDGEDGQDGSDGKSAYQVWLDAGNTGSEQDYLDSLKGPAGSPGEDGSDGYTSFVHIKYSNDGGQTFTGNGGDDTGDWIGVYTDFIQQDSIDVGDYKWKKIIGQSSYIHIKYSDDGGTTFTGNGGDDIGRYRGILTDSNEDASTDPSDYTWEDTQGSYSTFIADTKNDL